MTNEGDSEDRLSGGAATYALLHRASQLIETPATWTRGPFARDRYSHPVSPTNVRAVRFCVGGALHRAAAEEFGFSLRIARGDEPVTFVAPQPLRDAYRLLGSVMAFLLLRPMGVDVRAKSPSEESNSMIVHRVELGGNVIVEESTWEELVHAVNDHKSFKHRHVFMSVQTAVKTAGYLLRRSRDEKKDEKKKEGRS